MLPILLLLAGILSLSPRGSHPSVDLHFQSSTGVVLLSIGSELTTPVTLRNADGSLVAAYYYDGKQWNPVQTKSW